MKNLAALIFIAISISGKSQDTFSIVAIDSVTGEIGSAGASCLGVILPFAPHGAQIISDVIPGLGAVHTQAYWNATNQQNARARMLAGESPQQIIDWLVPNDAQGDSTIRQYGIVDYNAGSPRSAAFTGTGCNNYKSHITGAGYSIQGNILLGQQILDSMEAAYLNAAGSLADKLMAALQGANVTGADTRCINSNTSSLSAFLRVALPTDSIGSYYLDLYMSYPNVTSTTYPVDPIDSLQTLYTLWLASSVNQLSGYPNLIRVYKNEQGIVFDLSLLQDIKNMRLDIYDTLGRNSLSTPVNQKTFQISSREKNLAPGAYTYRFTGSRNFTAAGKIIL